MPALTQPKNLGDLLKYEAPNLYSREQGIVAATQNLPLGTVVGRETATAKLKALEEILEEAIDGGLGIDIDATLADRTDAILIARHAIVASGAVVWPSDITAPQQVAAISQLAALGILVRDSA